ncbi:MAG: DUF4417 domain-containing protein [Clostridia bacterium]|nr:DUF4417 domain-containing protein [Clostridia bacterium]
MTLENYNYRTDPLFLRNQFDQVSHGKYKIPIIPKAEFSNEDFLDLLLIGFDKAKANDINFTDRMVHFFLYDYNFEGIWKNPDKYIEKLKPYKAVLSPDFSMYIEMNSTMQVYNTFRNRFCGAYLASKGLKVIPTVSWGDESTFDFCFLGIPKGSTVAVSTYMASEHGNRKDQKDFFLKGYNEMLRQIEPERIVCYNTPFPEMKGKIVFVDYELSSWKYQNSGYSPSKYAQYITGEKSLPENCDLIIKRGYITRDFSYKGMGSAYGGEWQPKKESDKRFLGQPGEIKKSYSRSGVPQFTKIGKDGKAEVERHFSDHGTPFAHSNPHDHKIDWSKGFPNPSKPINYYGKVPEFKFFKENKYMNKTIQAFDELKFESLGDFKWYIANGCEVEFIWNDKYYSITHPEGKICIGEGYYLKDGKAYNILSHTEYNPQDNLISEDINVIMDYLVAGKRLGAIATEIGIVYRTI